MIGFKIKKLIITGEKVDTKSVVFEQGLNLITGPSDTGKSYIFQCIDFIFGKSKAPKKIKESKDYENVYLEIEDYKYGNVSTLYRSLVDLKYLYYENTNFENINTVTPKALDDKNENINISTLLLKLSNFELPILIKKNQSFDKVNFSFRNFSSYILIKEESMILERSPIYFGSYTDRTRNLHIFKFLLTGIDDSSYTKTEKKDIWSAKKKANIDLLNELLEKESNNLKQLENSLKKSKKNRTDKDLEISLESIQEQITFYNKELAKLEHEKNRISLDIKYNKNMKFKFKLLKEQYLSDIERLKFIDEGSFLMNQLKMKKCPHCGKNISELEHLEHSAIDMNKVNEACDYEIKKIELNLLELVKSDQTATDVIIQLKNDMEIIATRIKENINHLNTVLRPQLTDNTKKLNEQLKFKITLSDIENSKRKILDYQNLISETSSKKQITTTNSNEEIVKLVNDSSLPTLLENNLKKCLFSNEKFLPIKFYINSDSELDFMIKDNTRESYGKGYRSIMVSLFHISLLDYCIKNKLSHSNLLILDSPVNAFKGLSANEKLPESVQNKFFELLANKFKDRQIIIMENNSVLPALKRKINLIEFTKEKNKGRFGFF